ncbi:WecB/TagA/CpsF family glycosyltransferase [Thioclava sp. BHET1]|nr:WecB/TagA/CpsF family glycosyltransferase [Thioclava sp. BHET1]
MPSKSDDPGIEPVSLPPPPVAASHNLLGVRISAINLVEAITRIEAAIRARETGYVCVRDAHGVVRCQKDAELRRIHNRAFLVTPDGMPLVWSLRHAGHEEAGRVYGPDLMAGLFASSEMSRSRHFLYGTTPDLLAKLQERLAARFPRAQIVGSQAPPFRPLLPAEEERVAEEINASGADIVWVGLSTPKQERWMARMRDRLEAPMLIGVGAAFDFHAGEKPQAPVLIQRSGLEWLFRLACEPRRLWRRYAVTIPSFIALSLAQRWHLKAFPLTDDGPTRPVAADLSTRRHQPKDAGIYPSEEYR